MCKNPGNGNRPPRLARASSRRPRHETRRKMGCEGRAGEDQAEGRVEVGRKKDELNFARSPGSGLLLRAGHPRESSVDRQSPTLDLKLSSASRRLHGKACRVVRRRAQRRKGCEGQGGVTEWAGLRRWQAGSWQLLQPSNLQVEENSSVPISRTSQNENSQVFFRCSHCSRPLWAPDDGADLLQCRRRRHHNTWWWEEGQNARQHNITTHLEARLHGLAQGHSDHCCLGSTLR